MDEKEMQELRNLVEFLKANQIAEFDLERADMKVRLKFVGEPVQGLSGAQMAELARIMSAGGNGGEHSSSPSTVPAPVAHVHSSQPAAAPAVAEVKHHQVKSPIVGTFYESPSPGSPAFVKVGDTVEVGQVLCIVEAMKLMNEIESDIAGEVMERIAVAGQPVEYGQPLFAIKTK
jgi:acetyl-CoA carboxylase biotin carboxyl carrier protein